MWANLLKLLPVLGAIPFGPIFTFIGNVGKSMAKHPREWIIAGLLGTNFGTYWLWQNASDDLVKEKAAHVKTVEDFKAAQEEANRRAQAAKAKIEKEAKADADKADANYANLLGKYNANLLRYQANQSRPGGPGNSSRPAPEGGDGPGGSTDFSTINITLADAKVCAVNTARLQAVHEWAINLPKD